MIARSRQGPTWRTRVRQHLCITNGRPALAAPSRIVSTRTEADFGRATMYATLGDGSEVNAISWYVDELTFTPADAIGRTVEELRALRHERDVAYLRS
jgi:hypothetical protein